MHLIIMCKTNTIPFIIIIMLLNQIIFLNNSKLANNFLKDWPKKLALPHIMMMYKTTVIKAM